MKLHLMTVLVLAGLASPVLATGTKAAGPALAASVQAVQYRPYERYYDDREYRGRRDYRRDDEEENRHRYRAYRENERQYQYQRRYRDDDD